jgi:ABC-type transport system involved in cytochrome c biogenesis permease subunit
VKKRLPTLACVFALIFIVAAMYPRAEKSDYDLGAFGHIPVLHNGRVKPLETVARTTLHRISTRQAMTIDGEEMSATRWLLETIAQPERADKYAVIRIDHPELKTLIGVRNDERKWFSMDEVLAHADKVQGQYELARGVEKTSRSSYQNNVISLGEKILAYRSLAMMRGFVPVFSPAEAEKIGSNKAQSPETLEGSEAVASFFAILRAYHEGKPGDFNAAVAAHLAHAVHESPSLASRSALEAYFRLAQPFYNTIALYVIVFLLAGFSWLLRGWSEPLRRAALSVLGVAIVVHTAGLVLRVYLHGHPPITNLYASSLFVGWAAVLLALVLEVIYRNGVGAAAAGLVGMVTLIIAHNLSDGDDLEAVIAVLDTNLWLSTHVVMVSLGYASTFLAGALGITYIIGGAFTPALTKDHARSLARMIYGIVCFAMLASFVGTVLGGIWADQSWGRFWGWDPKENGALLVVLMNALILHARWAGMVKQRGLAALAVLGNIVTAWSWFGVNMLGVGLHSYGFMEKALPWLVAFVISQLMIASLALLPERFWWSFHSTTTDAATRMVKHSNREQVSPI